MKAEGKKSEETAPTRKKFTSKKPAPPVAIGSAQECDKSNEKKDEDPSAQFSWTKWE